MKYHIYSHEMSKIGYSNMNGTNISHKRMIKIHITCDINTFNIMNKVNGNYLSKTSFKLDDKQTTK